MYGNGKNNSQGGQGGRGRGRGPGGSGRGPVGTCVCPACGTEVPHDRGIPCLTLPCPKCGTVMVRGE